MFDSFLLTIQPDYFIKLSSWLKDNGEEIENTLTWDQKKILLPEEPLYNPNEEALEERYEQFETVR